MPTSYSRKPNGLLNVSYLQPRSARDKRRNFGASVYDALYLERLLLQKPPCIERVSDVEIYLINDNGKKRRVCGQIRPKLVRFVPDGMSNPHNVANPQDAYVCLSAAGHGTAHRGIGPCWRHNRSMIAVGDQRWKTWYKYREELLRAGFTEIEGVMTSEDFIASDSEAQDIVKIDLEEYEKLAREKYTPEQLLDTMRSLYQMEAVKLAVMDTLKRDGVSLDRLRTVSDQIVKSAQYQAAMAKRDLILMQGKAVEAITRALVTGMLAIVIETLGRDKAIDVLSRFRQELVLPVNDTGFTELLRRQQAAGMTDLVASLLKAPNEELAEFVDVE